MGETHFGNLPTQDVYLVAPKYTSLALKGTLRRNAKSATRHALAWIAAWRCESNFHYARIGRPAAGGTRDATSRA